MRRTDELIGDIISALRQNNLLDNSIIIITADHGEEFMEDGHYYEHKPESSSERLLHVPLMFYCTNMFEHKNISVPASTIDILPTISDLLNLRIPVFSRGVSLKKILLRTPQQKKNAEKLWIRPIYSEAWAMEGILDRSPGYNSNEIIFTVRRGKYRLKMTHKFKNRYTIIEKFELINWITNEKYDIKTKNHIFEELRHLLYGHIYKEGDFARYFYDKVEKQRIKKEVNKLKLEL